MIVNFHAGRQRFHSAKHQPAFEWRQNRAGGFLHESQLISLVLACADHDPTDAVAVAVCHLQQSRLRRLTSEAVP